MITRNCSHWSLLFW